MNTHPDCDALDCGCDLKEHKGYDTCRRQGMCNLLAYKWKDCGGMERLRVVQEELKARGVLDVKFAWAPDVHDHNADDVAGQVADLLGAYMRGECRKVRLYDGAVPECGTPPQHDWKEIFDEYRTYGRTDAWLYQKIQAHAARAVSATRSMPATKICAECGTSWTAPVRYCPQCGLDTKGGVHLISEQRFTRADVEALCELAIAGDRKIREVVASRSTSGALNHVVIRAVCDSENQPHQWIDHPEELKAALEGK